MSRLADMTIVNARVVTPFEVIEGGAVRIADGRIIGVGSTEAVAPTGRGASGQVVDAGGRIVAPGFVDLQVNGAGGYDCMSGKREEIAALAALLPQFGCTSFLPTTVTAARERLVEALRAIASAKGAAPRGARILGAHVEGPYLSSTPEGRGAHDVTQIRPFDPAEWAELLAAAEGQVRILTLAPEVADNLRHVPAVRERGIVVSVGHTAATYDAVAAAARAGASMATHAYNGMRGLHHREPGTVGAVLDLDQITAGLIADGYHVHPAAMRALVRVKGLDRVVAVTDAAWIAGLAPGEYVWAGGPITFDGRAPRTPDGRLAGSALTMVQAVQNLVDLVGLTLPQAIRLVTANPARVLGVDGELGSIQAGRLGDLVVLDDAGGRLVVRQTVVGGEVVYENPDR